MCVRACVRAWSLACVPARAHCRNVRTNLLRTFDGADENHVVYGVLTKEFDPNDDAERLETIGTQQPVIIGVRTRL